VLRFRLRVTAVLAGLFLPALGLCASLASPAPAPSFCRAAAHEGSCCGDEDAPPDTAPDRAPAPRCGACDAFLGFTAEEGPGLPSPEDAAPLPAFGGPGQPGDVSGGPCRLRSLAESPPLQLLHESFRN
jgi:hypothetical protein